MEVTTHSQDGELPGLAQPPSLESLVAEVDWNAPPDAVTDEPAAAAPAQDNAAPAPDPAEPDGASEQKELALSRGWVDQADYHGKAKWVDAETYNARHEAITPHLIREAKQLRTELRQRDERLQAQEARLAQLEQKAQEQQEAAQTIQLQTLQAQKIQAEQEGDFERANRIGNQLLDLRYPQPKAQPQRPQGPDPAVQRQLEDFASAHPEYKDATMQKRLAAEAFIIKSENPRIANQDLLDQAHEAVQALNVARPRAPARPAMAEMNGSPARPNGSAKGYNDLTQAEMAKAKDFFNTTPQLRKLDAKALAAAKADYLTNLPASAFRK